MLIHLREKEIIEYSSGSDTDTEYVLGNLSYITVELQDFNHPYSQLK